MTTIILDINEKNVIMDAIETRLMKIENLIDIFYKSEATTDLISAYKRDIDTLNNLRDRLTDEA